MIPKTTGSKFPPFFTEYKAGTVVKILTEPAPKDHPKLTAPFYCEVELNGTKYTLSLNMTSYYNISRDQAFGPDTAEWVEKHIKFLGMKKMPKGANARVWGPVEETIDLAEDTPF